MPNIQIFLVFLGQNTIFDLFKDTMKRFWFSHCKLFIEISFICFSIVNW